MAIYDFGDFRFDAVRGQLYRNGEQVELAHRAVPVLECLLQRPGQLLLKREILDCAWGEVAVAEHSLLEAMKLIRHALGDDAARPTYIKTVRRRGYQFIAEVTVADEAMGAPEVTSATLPPTGAGRSRYGLRPSTWTGWMAVLLVPLIAIAIALALGVLSPSEPDEDEAPDGEASDGASLMKRFEVALHPRYTLFNFVAVSPNGRLLAYSGRGPDGHRLLVKGIDEVEWTVLEDTDFPIQPSFSPDSRELVFAGLTYPGGPMAIQAIAAGGGSTRDVMVGGRPNDPTWQPDGFIYYNAHDMRGATLRRVASTGGPSEEAFPQLTLANGGFKAPVGSHGEVQILPGGKWLLSFWVQANLLRERDPTEIVGGVCLHSFDTGEERFLVEGAILPRYLSSGHLLYSRDGALWAQRFDPSTGELSTAAVRLFAVGPLSDISVSEAGVLMYTDRPLVLGQRPAWIDLSGEVDEISWPAEMVCTYPALSPDGNRIAAACASRDAPELTHIRVQEVRDDGVFRRVTPDGSYTSPVWSIDGERLFYAAESEGVWRIESAAVASPGEPDILWLSEHDLWPAAVSPDGSSLAFLELHPETNMDIWMLPLQQGGEAQPYLFSPGWESGPRFSPDGRWIAYHVGHWSSVEEPPNVFVAPADSPEDNTRVSSGNGHWPVWDPDGSRLFYLTPWNQAVMVLNTGLEPTFTQSVPEILLRPAPMVWTSLPGARGLDVGPDGDRFLFSVWRLANEPTRLYVVLDLVAELERLLPARE